MSSRRKANGRAHKKGWAEQPADLLFWFGDGRLGSIRARVKASTEVSIGRTDSRRALGFVVTRGESQIDFVLDKDQVAELVAYLKHCSPPLRKPLGRRRVQLSLVALTSPKHRLFMKLESAAQKAHPEYREVEIDEGIVEVTGPERKELVAWFKKTHPKAAARIERALTKELWSGG